MRVGAGERGQALIESGLFIPILFMMTLTLMYLSQIGVVQERAQSAVRFGNFISPQTQYKIENMYAALRSGVPAPAPYTNPVACLGNSGTDVNAALTESQTIPSGGATAQPTAQPFWQPSSSSATCTSGLREISNGAMPGISAGYVEVVTNKLTASKTAPGYLQSVFGAAFGFSAIMTVYLPLSINDLIYCTPGITGTTNVNGPWFAPNVGSPRPFPLVENIVGNPAGTYNGYAPTAPPPWSNNYNVGAGPAACSIY